VKPFFGNSTPVTGSSTESNTQSLDFPLMTVNGITKKEREKDICTTVKARLE
jgi:hypothetical protein